MEQYDFLQIPELAGEVFELQSIEDDSRILKVKLLRSNSQSVRIVFQHAIAYRKVDEGDALHILQRIKITSQLGGTLYSVHNSEFISWLFSTWKPYDPGVLKHYCLLTQNEIIDVLDTDLPLIEVG